MLPQSRSYHQHLSSRDTIGVRGKNPAHTGGASHRVPTTVQVQYHPFERACPTVFPPPLTPPSPSHVFGCPPFRRASVVPGISCEALNRRLSSPSSHVSFILSGIQVFRHILHHDYRTLISAISCICLYSDHLRPPSLLPHILSLEAFNFCTNCAFT